MAYPTLEAVSISALPTTGEASCAYALLPHALSYCDEFLVLGEGQTVRSCTGNNPSIMDISFSGLLSDGMIESLKLAMVTL